ncbi:MAG: hypothetical protein ACTSVW_04015 [Candidatus Njordarchaeales archaeon]
MKRLVESNIPLSELNETARREAGFIRVPKLSNLHPYLARRPTGTARVLTLTAVIPDVFDDPKKRAIQLSEIRRILGFDKVDSVPYKILYLINPDREKISHIVKESLGKQPKDIIVVDPMAGGGSIPLESLRLGFHTIAIEYNPVAYLILKATLEFPAKFGRKLYEDVKHEVEKLTGWVKREFKDYYPEDAYNYIIARGYICPNKKCKGLIPIFHSTKLSKRGPYIRLRIDKERRVFEVDLSSKEFEFNRLRCPYCGTPINKDLLLTDWIKRHIRLLDIALGGNVNEAKKNIEHLLKTHILLVKKTPKGFKIASREDKEAFTRAFLDLTRQINELIEFLPDAQIPRENQVFESAYKSGIRNWYQLFNPRQLLILLKLMKYVKNRSIELIKEKDEYGAAIGIYLAFGINKLFNFNNITTTWDNSTSTVRELIDHYSRTRRVYLGLEYCEAKRIDEALKWAYEPQVVKITRTAGGIVPLLRLLSEWLENLGDRIEIYCGDARKLSEVLKKKKADIINVDPPYLSQHYYSDLMEFFWQLLKVMLEPAIDVGYLFNRNPKLGRIELFIEGWSPYLSTLPRESEIISRRGKDRILDISSRDTRIVEKDVHSGGWYVLKMWEFFKEVYKVLKDDGVLIVWFTHSDPKAWEAIISSLYTAGFYLSKAWPTWTEMAQRRVALLTSAFFTSLVLVLRKRLPGKVITTGMMNPMDIIQSNETSKVISSGVADALQSAYSSKALGPEIFIMGLAGAIAGSTRIWNPDIERFVIEKDKKLEDYFGMKEELDKKLFRLAVKYFEKTLYPASIYLGSSLILKDIMKKAKLDDATITDILSSDNLTRAYLIFWSATRFTQFRELTYDFVEKICKMVNVDYSALINFGLLARVKKGSLKVYKVLFGRECYNAVNRRISILTRYSAGQAIHLLKLISEQPRDDVERVAKKVISVIPISRVSAAISQFLLRTARDDELSLVDVSILSRDYVDKVLEVIRRGVS